MKICEITPYMIEPGPRSGVFRIYSVIYTSVCECISANDEELSSHHLFCLYDLREYQGPWWIYSFFASLSTSDAVFCFLEAGPNPPVEPNPPAPRVVSSRSCQISFVTQCCRVQDHEQKQKHTSTCCNRGTEIRSRIICAIRSFGLTGLSADRFLGEEKA